MTLQRPFQNSIPIPFFDVVLKSIDDSDLETLSFSVLEKIRTVKARFFPPKGKKESSLILVSFYR